jgi:hypothetical protein
MIIKLYEKNNNKKTNSTYVEVCQLLLLRASILFCSDYHYILRRHTNLSLLSLEILHFSTFVYTPARNNSSFTKFIIDILLWQTNSINCLEFFALSLFNLPIDLNQSYIKVSILKKIYLGFIITLLVLNFSSSELFLRSIDPMKIFILS